MTRPLSLAALLLLAACGSDYQPELAPSEAQAPAAAAAGTTATAIFAGGCFWCTEADFEKVPGVTGAVSGYTGGRSADPTYEQVSAGGTGHYEAVRVSYDPSRVTYQQLADYYFRTVDPTDGEGQFCDKGESYRTAIFYADNDQRKLADREKAEASRTLGQAVATAILPAKAFYEAEGYHQDYYKTNSVKYRFYRSRCGRDERLAELWGAKAKG
ncbi:MAG TPA: peptide-methionine (S)-S-oxide reductase MsrA [Allosphingosinicella sp.]|jgi:methionine-S-sulfoxide reductase